MLTRFEAQGFKLLRDVAVDLTPLTVLVGANGTGKSTLLDGIDWLLSEAAKVVAGADEIKNAEWPPVDALGGRDLSEMLTRPSGEHLELVLHKADGRPLKVQVSRQPAQRATDSFDRTVVHPELAGLPGHIRLRLDTQKLAEPSLAAVGRSRLAADGRGLPTVLQDVASRRDGTIEAIESDLARIVPGFRRVHTDPVELNWTEIEHLNVEGTPVPRVLKRKGGGFRLDLAFDGTGRIPASQVSEGTLLALALITLMRVDAPGLILLDDAEHALHPAAQHTLVGILRDAIERNKDSLQIIATTHSPDFIDACQPEEIRVFGRKPDGSAAIRALTEHPEAEKWLGLLRVGEFWSSVGEDWVGSAGAPPTRTPRAGSCSASATPSAASPSPASSASTPCVSRTA